MRAEECETASCHPWVGNMLVNLTKRRGKTFMRNHSALTLRVNLGFSFFVKKFLRISKRRFMMFFSRFLPENCFTSDALIYLCAIVTPGRRAPWKIERDSERDEIINRREIDLPASCMCLRMWLTFRSQLDRWCWAKFVESSTIHFEIETNQDVLTTVYDVLNPTRVFHLI